MFGFLNDSWLGKVLFDVNKNRLLVGLSKDFIMVQDALFPTLLVCGDESVAKSSTLERLIGKKCLPIGKNIKTRRPLVICLRYQDESKIPTMKLKLPNKKEQLETSNDVEILTALEADFETIKTTQLGVDKEEGFLWIWSSTVPNVNLIDLPGLMHVAHLDEPGVLANLVKELVLSYIQKPNSIVLAIMDSNTRERQSPTVGLLRQVDPKMMIKVLTKPDLAIRMDDFDKMGEFVNHLNGEDVLIHSTFIVSLKSNYTLEGFDGTIRNEKKFFQDNLGLERFESLKSKLGIHALLDHISNLSEITYRKNWMILETRRYQTDLDNYQKQLQSLGPIFDSSQIASLIIVHLFHIPITQSIQMTPQLSKLELIMQHAWDDINYHVPSNSVFEIMPETLDNPPIGTFLTRFESRLFQEIECLFSDPLYKLFRFKKFKREMKIEISNQIKEKKFDFESQWTQLECHLWNSRNSLDQFDTKNWARAAKCYLVQKILGKFSNTMHTSLEAVFQEFLSQFSNEEDFDTGRIRTDITQKLNTIQTILKLL